MYRSALRSLHPFCQEILEVVTPVARCLKTCLVASLLASHVFAPRALTAQQLGQSPPRLHAPHANANLIAPEQLRSHPDLPTAYSVVEALHSNWLREGRVDPPIGSDGRARSIPYGFRSPAGENAGVQVYLDGHRLGGVELLRNIPTGFVKCLRHLSAIEAQARYGVGHSHGAILVESLAGSP